MDRRRWDHMVLPRLDTTELLPLGHPRGKVEEVGVEVVADGAAAAQVGVRAGVTVTLMRTLRSSAGSTT